MWHRISGFSDGQWEGRAPIRQPHARDSSKLPTINLDHRSRFLAPPQDDPRPSSRRSTLLKTGPANVVIFHNLRCSIHSGDLCDCDPDIELKECRRRPSEQWTETIPKIPKHCASLCRRPGRSIATGLSTFSRRSAPYTLLLPPARHLFSCSHRLEPACSTCPRALGKLRPQPNVGYFRWRAALRLL